MKRIIVIAMLGVALVSMVGCKEERDLDLRVGYDGISFTILSGHNKDLLNCKLTVNKVYFLQTQIPSINNAEDKTSVPGKRTFEGMGEVNVNLLYGKTVISSFGFSKDDGTRFIPFVQKPLTFLVECDEKDFKGSAFWDEIAQP